ncbi:MAG: hypothetical protein U0572_02170 [Phycisphaerales bacterium]
MRLATLSLLLYVASVGTLECSPNSIALAQCAYTTTVLIKPPGWSSIEVLDLDDSGAVVGFFKYTGVYQHYPFRWTSSSGFEVLSGPTGVTQRAARAVVSGVLIAGDGHGSGYPTDTYQLVVWTSSGAVLVPPFAPTYLVDVHAAVATGLVVGGQGDGAVGLKPFAWRDGTYLALPNGLSDGVGVINSATIDDGVCGWYSAFLSGSLQYPFLGSLSGIALLPLIDGLVLPEATCMNRCGHAVVTARTPTPPNKWHSYFWNGAAYQEIAMLPGVDSLSAWRMNEVDQTVGVAILAPPLSGYPPILWMNGTTYDLKSLTDAAPNASFSFARAINNNGVILVDGSQGATGGGFLLTPVTRDDADITLDCHVDYRDLMKVIDQWGPTANAFVPRADLDHDGMIGASDLAIVLGAWSP